MNNANDILFRKSFVRCWTHANPHADIDNRKSQLVDFLAKNFPQITRGGHRGLVNRMDIFNSCAHQCPKCNTVHVGMDTIAKKCGIRFMANRGPNGKFYFQSWCHDCRNSGARKDPADPTYGVRVNAANDDCVMFTN